MMGERFAAVYDTLMGPLERRRFTKVRGSLVSGLEGSVLEIGSGTGLNFPHYRSADEVTAIEPEQAMIEKSRPRAQTARVPVRVVKAGAEELPFPDHAFDAVVGTLVLCTIPQPEQALREVRRVCKPGGKVIFFEHVRMAHPIPARLQNWLTPFWKRICDGCHLNRDTLRTIRESGLRIENVSGLYGDLFQMIEAVNVTDDGKTD